MDDHISDPRLAKFAPETVNLFDEVDSAIAEIDEHRPFSSEIQGRISREFLPDRITATLNMEGISASRRQTLLMMDAMTLTENSTKEDQETYNALKADEVVYDLYRDRQPLTVAAVREINGAILQGLSRSPGMFRVEDVEISGAAFQPPSHLDVPSLVRSMVETFETFDSGHAIFKAAWLHATFTHIHPFPDGNGRTGRMLQDFVLLSSGLYPTGIPASMRDDYYDALEMADDGDWDLICQMIGNLQLRVLARIQAIISEVGSRDDFISALVAGAKAKKTGALHRQYTVWRQRMQQFGEELKAVSDDLNRRSHEIGVRTDLFEPIDFEKYKRIKSSGWAPNTWFVKQTWYAEGTPFFRTILFFARHVPRPEDRLPSRDLEDEVSLFITGGPPEYGAKYSFTGFSDNDIRFRELFFANDESVVYYDGRLLERHEALDSDSWVWCDEKGFSTIVKELIHDLFVRKLGID